MDYQTFISEIQREIIRQLPEQYQDIQAEINKVMKNNGTELVGLMLHRPGEAVFPQLYLEQPYGQFQKGEPIEKIAKELAETYLQSRDIKQPNVPELVSDFEKARELLQLQLISKEYNRERLEEVPQEDRLSDEVYYYDKDEHCLSMATSREDTEELKGRLSQTGHADMAQEAEMEMEER